MGNLGGGEILVILLAALLFLGPQKLPDAARQLGRAMGEFRKVTSGFQRELREAMNDDSEATARTRGEAIAATRPVPPQIPSTPPEPSTAPPAADTPAGRDPDEPPAPTGITQPGGGL
jgi:Tat protein translocase TatB subunit